MLSRRELIASAAAGFAPVRVAARARRCLFLVMEGGPSHIDTFDPKPALKRLHGTASRCGRRYVASPFGFRRAAELGIEINEGFERLSEVVDDFCFYRGLQAASANHTLALADLAPAGPVTYSLQRALRLLDEGTRLVQVRIGGWDSHEDLESGHGAMIRAVDRPVADLICHLKRTGLLDETLVVWAGEFGRSPDSGSGTTGRDHNPKAMTVWLAGGGVAGGRIVGATDELGQTAVEAVRPIEDFHATIAALLGAGPTRGTPIPELVG
jgi:hypothetical protein